MMKRIYLVLSLILLALISGCYENKVNEPTGPIIPLNTSTSLNQETALPTSTPTPIPTPDATIELMNQINLFLNSDVPYRENEDLYWIVFRPYKTKTDPKLGLINVNTEYGSVNLQGVFLGYAETVDGIVLLLGVHDKDENRFVTPLKLYDEKFELFKDTQAGFQYMVEQKDYINFVGEPIVYNNKEDVMKFLSSKIGQVFGIQLSMAPQPPFTNEDKEFMLQAGWTDPEGFYEEMNDFILNFMEKNKNLVASLWVPAPEDEWWGSLTLAQDIQKFGNPTGTAIRIGSAEDIKQVLHIKWLPSPDFIMGTSR